MQLHEEMREAATVLLDEMGRALRAAACHPFDHEAARRWIEYRPEARPGVSLEALDRRARKAAHRLLATALSPHAYAQAMTIVALEEVLDRSEGWERGRHSNDYWVVLFGDPANDERWGWRFEGHHVSVSMTVDGDRISPTPLFLGANPARVRYGDTDVVRPLALEEELARSLLDAMTEEERWAAVLDDVAPADILSERQGRVPGPIEPLGVSAGRLSGAPARDLLERLLDVYLDRLPPALARQEEQRIDRAALTFAWAGPLTAGSGHYYRIQAPDLLIEYDNTQNDANHIHSVLRRPESDFGGDALRAHRSEAHR
jgi:hypothetical protein